MVEIVEQLDLRSLTESYAGRGSQRHNPPMLVALLFYGYPVGIFSSRKLERSTYDSSAFRYIAANQHPGHDTIANFRKRFLKDLSQLFVQILLIAPQMGVLKLGSLSGMVSAVVLNHYLEELGSVVRVTDSLEGGINFLIVCRG